MTSMSQSGADERNDSPRSPQLTASEALEAARRLGPKLLDRAEQTEAMRRIPDETIADLLDSGLFGIATPHRWGGSDLGYATCIEVTAELAAACPSTGWVFGVLIGHFWLMAAFPEEAQREVFGNPRSLVASLFRLGGSVERVDGGYLWREGSGRFCSGVDHSDWVISIGNIAGPDDSPQPHYFLFQRGDFKIVDDWHTVGMRGTGSKSIKLAPEVFIPAHRTFAVGGPADSGFTASLVGAPLGIARGALQVFERNLVASFQDRSDEDVSGALPGFVRLAKAAADIESAFLLSLTSASWLDELNEGEALGGMKAARYRRNQSYAVQQCRHAVNSLFEASGGRNIYETEALQRYWRDMNTASAHTGHNWENAAVGYGMALLGVTRQRRRGHR